LTPATRSGPMDSMRRACASVGLLVLLVCSSAGICWTELVRSGHDCCDQADGMAPAKGCASTLHSSGRVTLAVPGDAITPLPLASAWFDPVHAPVLDPIPTSPRPLLVLRI